MKHSACYIKDYPRPQLVRKNYTLLNGKWDFALDKDNTGMEKEMFKGFVSDREINVPFVYTTEMSGVNIKERCDCVWYQRTVRFTESQLCGKILLHLEGSDYITEVYVNGTLCGTEKGGYHRLTFDLTPYASVGENKIVIRITDSFSTAQVRGKQRWQPKNFGCFYVETTGIWKTVWLEFVPKTYISGVFCETYTETSCVDFVYQIDDFPSDSDGWKMNAEVFFDGKKVGSAAIDVTSEEGGVSVWLGDEVKLWDVFQPNLYDFVMTLEKDGKAIDVVSGYFGMRDVETADGKILLNGKPLYQKLILDQGYWQGSDLTPPSEEALEKDITDMIAMGFNGARKHQKVEDERFLYYADVYGYLVWAEMPSMHKYTEEGAENFIEEWTQAVMQQYNHPSIVCWVPFNESWGIQGVRENSRIQWFVNKVYDKTKQLDEARPVVTNDGWEHTKSDILTIHHYEQDGEKLHAYFDSIEKCYRHKWESHHTGAFANGYGYDGQPIIISEFGGTAYDADATGDNWGYGESVANDAEFADRFAKLIGAIDALPFMSGYCYTQLSDVQQEVNGLLKENRMPKLPFDTIKAILEKQGR